MHRFWFLIIFLSSGAALADTVTPSDRVRTGVNVRAQATSSSEPIATLRPGDVVDYLDSEGRWYQIRLPDNREGFVSKSWTVRQRELAARQQDELRIHYLNIGGGTCTIAECPGPDAPPMIIDCGSLGGSRGPNDMDRDDARTYIQRILGGHAAAPNVVLSHGDTDHYGWISEVLRDTQATNIWMGGESNEYDESGFPTWLNGQIQGGATVFDNDDLPEHFHNNAFAIDDSQLDCGDALPYVLTVNTGSSKNAHSLVLSIDYGEFSAILSGDAEGVTERRAIRNFDNAVKATVLSGSHHGAATQSSNSVTWAENTAPVVVIYSSGRRFGHPRCGATERYDSTLAVVPSHPFHCGNSNDFDERTERNTTRAEYVTEVNGTIVVTTDGGSPLMLNCESAVGCSTRIPH